jgi:hypothetical protein
LETTKKDKYNCSMRLKSSIQKTNNNKKKRKAKTIMAFTKEQVKAALLAQKEKKGGSANNQSKRSGGDNASFPFWNIPDNTEATVRFLPDGDASNDFFWVVREVINLPFAGIVGGDYPTDNEVTVQVPCVDMFGMTCPIIAATRPWWKDPSTESLARKYWKKKSFIFQGFVLDSKLSEDNVPENPIRRFMINKSIFDIIEKSLISDDMEDLPTDFIGGREFKIAKTKKGGKDSYANYTTSSWSFKPRSLSETEMNAISAHGLHDLKASLGQKPDAGEMDVIKALFDASVAGEPFDYASYGHTRFRPWSARNNDAPSRTVERQVTEAVTPRETTPAATETASTGSTTAAKPNPADILARIRARTAQ